MTGPAFYDAEGLERVAVNLFYGWGYNHYRLENLLRADDLLIRQKSGGLLALARGSIEAAESSFRRQFLPPPSRAEPRPDPEAVAAARVLERLSQGVGALEGQVRAQPVPETDRMTQWYRAEAAALTRLRDHDMRLVAQAETLRAMLDGRDAAWMAGHVAEIETGLGAVTATLRDRQAVLGR